MLCIAPLKQSIRANGLERYRRWVGLGRSRGDGRFQLARESVTACSERVFRTEGASGSVGVACWSETFVLGLQSENGPILRDFRHDCRSLRQNVKNANHSGVRKTDSEGCQDMYRYMKARGKKLKFGRKSKKLKGIFRYSVRLRDVAGVAH